MYFHKPADLTQIDYSPLQHMSRSLDDYMKIPTKRFDVLEKVVLYKKTHDQSVQQIRQNRIFPRNQTFAVVLCRAVWSNQLILMCLGVIILHMIVCTAIHNCSSSGSLFFATLRQNN